MKIKNFRIVLRVAGILILTAGMHSQSVAEDSDPMDNLAYRTCLLKFEGMEQLVAEESRKYEIDTPYQGGKRCMNDRCGDEMRKGYYPMDGWWMYKETLDKAHAQGNKCMDILSQIEGR
ncbi:hypothetical protein N9N82_11940 [Luminiphilus sp.]|nr:hypothetical protein [Luminiphilus sp.]